MIEYLKDAFEKARFLLRHETTEEIATHAREAMLADKRLVDEWREMGLIDNRRLEEIRHDEEMQELYSSYMRIFRTPFIAEDKIIEAVDEITQMSANEIAGWFEYYQRFYEERWNLKLLSPED